MEIDALNTNESLDSMDLLDCIGENDEDLYFEEEGDEDFSFEEEEYDEDYFSQDDNWYDEEDYSDDGCGEGYSCYNCPNFGCPSNPYN